MSLIRIATRNSPLALWQANFVMQELQNAHADLVVEIVGMTTRGDQLLDRSLANVGGKALFLKELEVSLLNNETDIAVHSMKDVPVELPEGLEIAVVCERADPRDAFVSNSYQNLYALPQGARVGTSSLRRISQLRNAFPKLEFAELRGNVNTRLAKLDAGEYDAIILAAAGLIRLGFAERIKQYITPELCLPAVGQGIIGIECRSDDANTIELLQPLHNRESALFLAAERAMNEGLNGGCQVPVAGFAEVIKGKIRMRGMVGAVDGSKTLTTNMISPTLTVGSAGQLGRQVAKDLMQQGATKILQSIEREPLKLQQSDRPVVVLTRQSRYLGNTAAILQTLEYQAVPVQTLQVKPRINDVVSDLFANLERYTDIVFISRNAVEIGMSILEQVGSAIPESVRVMTVGPETAKQLYKYKIDALFPAVGSGAEALLAVKQLADLSDRKIVIVRGTRGLEWPAEEMRKRGAQVDHVDVYTQSMPDDAEQRMQDMLEAHQRIEGVFLHSAQSAKNFMRLAEPQLERFADATLVAGSQRIAETAKAAGWSYRVRVAKTPSNKDMMIAFSASYDTGDS